MAPPVVSRPLPRSMGEGLPRFSRRCSHGWVVWVHVAPAGLLHNRIGGDRGNNSTIHENFVAVLVYSAKFNPPVCFSSEAIHVRFAVRVRLTITRGG